jgi:hypothetical protein
MGFHDSLQVCQHYGVDQTELSRRGSRSPARAALAYVARQHTEATLSDLVPILGLSRPESVPNLSRKFSLSLQEAPCGPGGERLIMRHGQQGPSGRDAARAGVETA